MLLHELDRGGLTAACGELKQDREEIWELAAGQGLRPFFPFAASFLCRAHELIYDYRIT